MPCLKYFSLTLALATLTASAQDVRLFRADQPASGTKWRESTELAMRRLKLKAEAEGTTLFEARFTGVGRMIHDLEYSSPDQVSIQVRRNRFAARTESEALPGDEEVETNSLEGHTVLGQRQNGKWTFKLSEGEPTDEQIKEINELEDILSADAEIYPSQPVEVGHAWKITGQKIAGVLGGGEEMDNLDGELNLKLEAIEQVDGLECARISVQGTASFDFKPDEEDGDEVSLPSMKAQLNLKGSILRSLLHGADAKINLGGDMTITSDAQTTDLTFQISMAGPFEMNSQSDFSPDATQTEIPKDPPTPPPPATKSKKTRSFD